MTMDISTLAGRAASVLAIAGLFFLCWAPAMAGQDFQPERSTADGVFTEEQAEEGAQVYDQVCAACHFTSQFSRSFMQSWTGGTVYSLYQMIRQTMPYDRPGSLSPQQYTDVVAYLLDLNGFPTGSSPLPPAEDALKNVLIERSQNR